MGNDNTEYIEIRGARAHNLKGVSLSIPRDRFVVITGLSGSGKSSLAFDTIYAEGQRRYMDTLSAYAKQFMGILEKPEVESITGLSPIIAIEQKTTGNNPRSTVGTITEIYDFLRLLYAKASRAYSPATGREMVRYTDQQIVDLIIENYRGRKCYLLAPLVKGRKGHYKELFDQLRRRGYTQVRIDGELKDLSEVTQLDRYKAHFIELVIDRLKPTGDDQKRIRDSVMSALNYGKGSLAVMDTETAGLHHYSKHLVCPETGLSLAEPAPHSFSFNSPQGYCPHCKGLGMIVDVNMDTIVPDRSVSIADGGIVPLGKIRETRKFDIIRSIARKYNFSLYDPICELPDEVIPLIVFGSDELFRVGEGGLSETATVMWWRSAEKEVVDKVTANGNRVIMCPNYDFYLDYAEARSSLKRIYDSRMNFDDLTDAQKAKILGVQGNIWGEFIPSREWMQYMAFPRLLAVAETGWSKQGSGYEDFRNRMIGQFDRLDRLNVNYRLPDLEGFFDVNIFLGKADVTVSCHDPKAKVYYTTDGTDPDMNSQVYDKPFTITESDTIAFRAFRPNGRYSKIHRAVYLKKDAFTPAKEGFAPQNKGLTVTWHDGIVKNCADIVNHPVKKEMVIDGIRLPEDSKGNLGLIFKGYFLAHEDGVYSFNLSSDDGSMLYIDGNIVVDDNSNGHTRRDISGQCALAKGWHPVEVRYFDRFTGCLSLEVYGTDGKIMTPVFGY